MRIAVIVLALLGLLACAGEGANVALGEDGKPVVDAVEQSPGDRVTPVDGREETGDDPEFHNKLGWKVIDAGEEEAWLSMWGVVKGDSYDLFVTGDNGAVLWHSAGEGKWHDLGLSVAREVNGVWAESPEYVVVCGEGGLLRRYFDSEGSGPQWSEYDETLVTYKDFKAIHGTSSTDIWVAGVEGLVFHFNGQDWSFITNDIPYTTEPPPDLVAVWAVSPTRAYFISQEALIIYDNGYFTVDETTFKGRKLKDIKGLKETVWIAGDKGAVFERRADGTLKKHQANAYSQFNVLWVLPQNIVYAIGKPPQDPMLWSYDQNDKDSWGYTPIQSPDFIKTSMPNRIVPQSNVVALWGTSAQDLWVATKEMQVIHYAVHP